MFNILYDCMGFLLLKVLLGNHLMIILGTWSNEYEQALHLPFWMLSHVWSYSMNTTQTSPAHVYVDNMDSLGSGGPRDHDRDYIVQLCGAANVLYYWGTWPAVLMPTRVFKMDGSRRIMTEGEPTLEQAGEAVQMARLWVYRLPACCLVYGILWGEVCPLCDHHIRC